MSPTLLEEIPIAAESEIGPLTRADYERLPDEPRCELIYGRLYVSPSPSPLHQVVTQFLGRLIDDIALAHGGLSLIAPMDVHLALHSVAQPDVLYLSRGRRALVGRGVEGAPDLAVEVISPGTARRDRGEKLRLYAETGVGELWLVDPAERQVEFLVNENGRFVVTLPTGKDYRSPRLPELELDLVHLWAEVDRRLPG
ncbi:MAG TPA: Uma2 family endonuclease [Thermoanaerobaculia bacterium]|nr:Uma2 family endonuclease [Thermoanaerobaculia bacterium]